MLGCDSGGGGWRSTSSITSATHVGRSNAALAVHREHAIEADANSKGPEDRALGKTGAAEESRTLDLNLGNVRFPGVALFDRQCSEHESNVRPAP